MPRLIDTVQPDTDAIEISKTEQTFINLQTMLEKTKELKIIDDDDIAQVAGAVAELTVAGSDQQKNEEVIAKLLSHFFEPSNVVKRIELMSSDFPILKAALPFISKLINRK